MDWSQVPWPVVSVALGGLVWLIYWADGMNEHRKTVATFKKEIRDDIKKIFERIPPPNTLGAASPLGLSELGKKVAAHLDTSTWASQLAPTLTDEISGKRAFEIDQFCEEYVDTRIDDQLRERVSVCAYDLGLTRPAVLAVLRVELRDELIRLTGAS